MLPLALFDLAEAVGRWLVWGIMTAINGVIAAVGGLLALLFSLFPALPSKPTLPDGGFLHAFAWFVPVGSILALVSIFVAAWISMLLIRVALRWAKGI